MANIYLSFLLIVCATGLWMPALKGSHASGAHMSYETLENGNYRVRVVFYRDCDGVPFNVVRSPLVVRYTDESGQARLFNYPMKVAGSSALDLLCSDCSPCNDPSCDQSLGIERYVLTTTFKLSDPTVCKFRLSWQVDSRNHALTTVTNPDDEYLYLTIDVDRCKVESNSSPETSTADVRAVCTESCQQLDLGMSDADGDSLVYSLTAPLTAGGGPVPYVFPYSAQAPFDFAAADAECNAFKLDSSTGILNFKPTREQVAQIGLKIEEYRNGEKIGEYLRDVQLLMIQCDNAAPELLSTDTLAGTYIEGCAGQPICFSVRTDDADGTDSVRLELISGPPGGELEIGSGRLQTGMYCWTPPIRSGGAKIYTVVIKAEDDACPTSEAVTEQFRIRVKPTPTATYTAAQHNCGDVGFDLSNLSNSAALIEWRLNDTVVFNTPDPVYRFEEDGMMYYKLTLDNGTCKTYYEDSILLTPFPHIEFPYSYESCLNDSSRLHVDVKYAATPYQIEWSNGAKGETLTTFITRDTAFTVKLTDAAGCVNTRTAEVKLHPAARSEISFDRVCQGGTGLIDLDDYITPWGGAWTGFVQDSGYLDIGALNTGKYSLSYHHKVDSLDCISRTDFEFRVVPPLEAEAGLTFSVCSRHDAAELTTGRPRGGYWTGPGVRGGNTFEPAGLSVGLHKLVYHYQEAGIACEAKDTLRVNIYSTPTVEAGTYPDVCVGADTVQLNGQPADGRWLPADGLLAQNKFYPSDALIGERTFVYRKVFDSTCRVSDTTRFSVHALPEVSLQAPEARRVYCMNYGAVELAAEPSGGTFIGAVDDAVFDPAVLGIGVHRVVYNYTDAAGCSAADTFDAEVRREPWVRIAGIERSCRDLSFRIDLTGSLADSFTFDVPIPGQLTALGGAQWFFEPDTTAVSADSICLKVTGFNAGNCRPVSDSTTVYLLRRDHFSYRTRNASGCAPLDVKFDLPTEEAFAAYEWSFGDGDSSEEREPSHLYRQPGEYTVCLTVRTTEGCLLKASQTAVVRVSPPPVARFEPTPAVATIQEPTIRFQDYSVNTLQDISTYRWVFADTIGGIGQTAEGRQALHRFSDTGHYPVRLIVENLYGCRDTAVKTVYIGPDVLIFIPNAFTPYGTTPGKNDIFKPEMQGVKAYKLVIFDKWGRRVFETKNPDEGWSGKSYGQELGEGVYMYRVEVTGHNDDRYTFNGAVTLLR